MNQDFIVFLNASGFLNTSGCCIAINQGQALYTGALAASYASNSLSFYIRALGTLLRRVALGSLSDLKEIGCKSVWLAHISLRFFKSDRLLVKILTSNPRYSINLSTGNEHNAGSAMCVTLSHPAGRTRPTLLIMKWPHFDGVEPS